MHKHDLENIIAFAQVFNYRIHVSPYLLFIDVYSLHVPMY